MSVAAYLPEYEKEWAASGKDPITFFFMLKELGYIDQATYEIEIGLPKETIVTGVAPETLAPEAIKAQMGEALYDFYEGKTLQHETGWLASLWLWIKEHLGPLIDMVVGAVKSALLTAWEWIKSQLEALGGLIFKGVSSLLSGASPITPEQAPMLALKLYGFAMTQGMAAHSIAVITENVHPLKNLGLSQIAAMVGDLSAFGRIAAATIGVYTSVALAGPMRYAVQSETRPVIPDARTLQTLAVKQDITLDEFRNQMKYHGFRDYWIGRIEASMYREPMYRELLIMAESDVATDAWMVDKLRRAGYDSTDAAVMHKALLKRIALTQRSSYYSQAFSLFKEGYINQDLFARVLDELEMRPEAKQFAVKAANLAYLYDATSDQVKYWCDSYQKDLLTDDQLRLHLSLLGIVPERVWLLAQIQRVKKYKKPSQPTASGLEKVTTQVQDKYSQAYIQLYRKGLIDTDMLLGDLVAIGIVPDLAEATVFLEAARAA
jgi:hypothetical protein